MKKWKLAVAGCLLVLVFAFTTGCGSKNNTNNDSGTTRMVRITRIMMLPVAKILPMEPVQATW